MTIHYTYTIEQCDRHGRNWEPTPEGDFSSLREARRAMQHLERELGWTGMRIVSDADDMLPIYGAPPAVSDETDD